MTRTILPTRFTKKMVNLFQILSQHTTVGLVLT